MNAQEMEIRNGCENEIKNFPLYCEDNEFDTLHVVEHENKIVAYAQMSGEQISFMESAMRGAGGFLMKSLQTEYDHLIADNVVTTAKGFYSRYGFEDTGKNYYGQPTMEWWAE